MLVAHKTEGIVGFSGKIAIIMAGNDDSYWYRSQKVRFLSVQFTQKQKQCTISRLIDSCVRYDTMQR